MNDKDIFRHLDNLHSKIVRSPFAKNVTENEISALIECKNRIKAKKPVKDKYKHGCCPNCGWIVYQDEWGGRYLPHCENCGQAINWTDTNLN